MASRRNNNSDNGNGNHEAETHRLAEQVEELHRRLSANRLWDIASKIAVPIVLALGAAAIRNEIVDGKQDTRLNYTETAINKLPPEWMRSDLKAIQAALDKQATRLQGIETDIAALKAKVK